MRLWLKRAALIFGLALLMTILTLPRAQWAAMLPPQAAPAPTPRLLPCGDRYGGSYITGAGRIDWCVKGHRFRGY